MNRETYIKLRNDWLFNLNETVKIGGCANDVGFYNEGFRDGSDYIFDLMQKEVESFREHNNKIINESIEFSDTIKQQAAIIERLSKLVTLIINQPFEGNWDAQAVYLASELADIKKLREGE